jgi:hypothetical protein
LFTEKALLLLNQVCYTLQVNCFTCHEMQSVVRLVLLA